MKNKLITFAVLTACLGLSGLAFAQNPPKYPALKSGANTDASPAAKKEDTAKKGATTTGLSDKDRAFMKEAADGGTMEVEWGKWAKQKGQSAEVKKIGEMMVADHSKANNELMSIAQSKGVKLSPKKPKGAWKSDKDYLDMMVMDHTKDWNAFQAEAKNGSDADVKKFADKTSAVIKKHLDAVKKAQSKMKS